VIAPGTAAVAAFGSVSMAAADAATTIPIALRRRSTIGPTLDLFGKGAVASS
jgi:hypothetical protein